MLARGEEAVDASAASVVFVLPGKAWTAMTRHSWPGNVRQFEMVLIDVLASALYGGLPPAIDGRDGQHRAVFAIEARMVFSLLTGASESDASTEKLVLKRPRAPSVAGFRRELERAAFRALFREAGGDFERMSRLMTGSTREARAARLRFNRLGLSAREEK
jgi:DNA-binding NtrC family response regulator